MGSFWFFCFGFVAMLVGVGGTCRIYVGDDLSGGNRRILICTAYETPLMVDYRYCGHSSACGLVAGALCSHFCWGMEGKGYT